MQTRALGALFNAIAAVSAGFADHVLVLRTLTESSAQTAQRRASVVGTGSDRVGGPMQWMVPFRAVSAANWIGVYAQRYMHDSASRASNWRRCHWTAGPVSSNLDSNLNLRRPACQGSQWGGRDRNREAVSIRGRSHGARPRPRLALRA